MSKESVTETEVEKWFEEWNKNFCPLLDSNPGRQHPLASIQPLHHHHNQNNNSIDNSYMLYSYTSWQANPSGNKRVKKIALITFYNELCVQSVIISK